MQTGTGHSSPLLSLTQARARSRQFALRRSLFAFLTHPLRHFLSLPLLLLVLSPSIAPALGILVPRLAESSPIHLGHAEVHVTIRQNIANTRVMQEFFNPNPRQLEADYYFPVPKG